jgi:hypothetical protein
MIRSRSTTRHAMLPTPPFAASFLAALALAGAALLAAPAQAADKPSPTTPAKTNPDAVLTPAQLRDCVAQKDRLRADTDATVKSKAGIDAIKAAITSAGAALAEEAATLDRTKEEAVAAYNAKVEARNALIDSYQAKAEAYNKNVEGVQTTQEAYAKACGNRRYDDRDLNDLQKKK